MLRAGLGAGAELLPHWATCPAAASIAMPTASAATARSSSATATRASGDRGVPLDGRRRHGRPGRPARRRLLERRQRRQRRRLGRRRLRRLAPRATEAFRWTTGGGMVGLGDLPGGNFYSDADGVSGDGSVVVGCSDSASGDRGVPLDGRRRAWSAWATCPAATSTAMPAASAATARSSSATARRASRLPRRSAGRRRRHGRPGRPARRQLR